MPTTVHPRFVRRLTRLMSTMLIAFLFLGALPESASAVSSWSPTLLVNTESFQTIDSGDGTTDIELRFGSTSNTIKFLNALQKFQLSKSLSVVGSISGSSLTIDGVASISGSLTVKNNIAAKGTVSGSTLNGFGLGSCNASYQKLIFNSATGKFECAIDAGASGSTNTGNVLTIGDARYVNVSGDTMTGALNVRSSISGSQLTISGQANLSGALTVKGAATLKSTLGVTGAISTDADLTINSDAGAVDASLTFGNDSGNQTIKFLNSAQKFEFSTDVRVIGSISGSALTVDGTATVQTLNANGNVAAKGSLSGTTFYGANLGSCNGAGQKLLYNYATGKFQCGIDLNGSFSTGNVLTIGDDRYVRTAGDTMTGALNVRSSISGSQLTISGQANLSGALTVKGAATLKSTLGVTGAISTDADLTINSDAGAVDSVLTFGNDSGNQTVKFLNSSQKFQFSKDISVVGNISGSTLTVDGAITLHGVTYNAPSAQGGANTFLKNDGAGNLTWTATSVGNSSGSIMSMHPDYPGAVYFASGASMIGQLTMSGGTTDFENSYAWTTSRGTLQDYWISVRGRVPDNFSSWDPVKAVEFRFKTGVAGAQNNHLSLKIRDTAGALQTLTGGLVGTAYTTARVPALSGTWNPKGYFTVYVKVASTSAANAAAYASYLNMNYETLIP